MENRAQLSGSTEPNHESAGMSGNGAALLNVNGNTSTTNTDPQSGNSQQALQPNNNQSPGFRQHFARYRQSLEAAIQEIDGVTEAGNTAITSNTSAIPASDDQNQHNSSVEHLAAEGPMTPRNDVGPFVLDGNPRNTTPPVLVNLNAATSPGSDSDFNLADYNIYLGPFTGSEPGAEQEQEL